MGYEPFVLELKLDTNTVFEWQKHSQDSVDVPHYSTQSRTPKVYLRAQASESSVSDTFKKQSKHEQLPIRRLDKQITSTVANMADSHSNYCILCKHPLYTCSRFKSMNHNQRVLIMKSLC